MIPALRPYPVYKDSGVPWLNRVPGHWDVVPALAAYRERQIQNTGMLETTVLSLSYGRIVVKPPNKLRGLVPESFETYQVVDPGNIVVRTTDLQNDQRSLRVGYARDRGIITAAYMCLETTRRLSQQYGYQILNAYDLLKVIYGFGSGLRQNLSYDDIKRTPVLVPPPDEQAAIVGYLDYMDRRIRRYIRAKQKLINLLEEEKQAIIHRAVTGQVDIRTGQPHHAYKPSGVEWLGDVPATWEVRRLKDLASHIVDCLHATPSYVDDGPYPAIRTADVLPGELLLEKARRVDAEQYGRWTARMAPIEGDILYTREGERFGIAALVPPETALCISQRMMAFRIGSNFNSEYLMWQINCRHVYAQAAGDVIGSAAPHVNVEQIRNFRLVVPSRAEQDAIVQALAGLLRAPRIAAAQVRREIELVREYRTRLIADVVTGKLDVREAAAHLPDQPDDAESLDQDELLEEELPEEDSLEPDDGDD